MTDKRLKFEYVGRKSRCLEFKAKMRVMLSSGNIKKIIESKTGTFRVFIVSLAWKFKTGDSSDVSAIIYDTSTPLTWAALSSGSVDCFSTFNERYLVSFWQFL